MRIHAALTVFVAACLLAAAQAGAQEGEKKVSISQVPEKVKTAILKEVGDGKLVDIGEFTDGEKNRYEIELVVNGVEFDVLFSADGKVLKKTSEGPTAEGKATQAKAKSDAAPAIPPGGKLDPTDGSYRFTLETLPAPVREMFLKQAAGNVVKGFSMEIKNGKPIFDCDVFIDGKKYAVIADADGKLISKPIGELKPEKELNAEGAAKAGKTKKDKKNKAAKGKAAKTDFRSKFTVDKASLSDQGSGEYFVLQPGYRLTFTAGMDTLTITVLDETKMVDGVKTRVVEERETKDGKLEEISRNWFAIDKTTGDAYYFGETVDIYDNGKVISHGGSWESGVDGAKFGLAVPGKPKIGEKYYQEVAPKVAMDRAEVVSVSETLKVPAGKFTKCLKTEESSDLEPGSEVKIYAPEIGLIKDEEFVLSKKEFALPETVEKAFKAAFPKAAIEKLDVEEEDGVMVYDFEFKNGEVEQETDIAGDGTILEVTLVIEAKDLPAPALKAIEKAAAGAKLGRIEHIDIRYETKDGKAVKLANPVTHYAAEYGAGDKSGEAVVTADGMIVEE